MKKALYIITTITFTIALFFNMNITCAHSDDTSLHYTHFPQKEGSIRIMSYNILADSIGFDGIGVVMREKLLKSALSSTSPDILCLQEVSNNWYKSLKKLESQFRFTAPLRNKLCMCMTPILYNTQKLSLINSGIESYSCSFDSRIRCISWAYFSQKHTNIRFVVINTHLSLYDKNQHIPLLQATQLLEFISSIKAKYNCSVFIGGDFNSKQRGEEATDSSTYEYLSLNLNDCRFYAKNVLSGKEKSAYSPINDYIFFTGKATIDCYTLLSLPILKPLSDHYPIYADVILS